MLRLKVTLLIVGLSTILASCQSVQPPAPVVAKPSVKVIAPPKEDKGLKVINIAIEQVKNKQIKAAKELLEAYLLNQKDSRAQINLALIYVQTKQIEEAKTLLLEVLQSNADDSVALEHLAIIARQQGNFKQAQRYYLQALKLSNKPSIHLNYAILLDLYLNQLTAALNHYEIYQKSGLAKQDGIELDQWIADLKVRLKREN